MSEAVDNAGVMLSCISLAYKESASKDPRSSALHVCHLSASRVSRRVSDCRLELQYGHQSQVEMLPLMMEKNYRPTGWRKSQYLYLVLRFLMAPSSCHLHGTICS